MHAKDRVRNPLKQKDILHLGNLNFQFLTYATAVGDLYLKRFMANHANFHFPFVWKCFEMKFV